MSGLAKLIGYLVLFGLAGFGAYSLWKDPQVQTIVEDIIGPTPITLIDEKSSIGSPDADLYHFSVKHGSKVRLLVDVQSQYPIDIITTQGRVSKAEYVMTVGLKNLSDFFSLIFPEETSHDASTVFENPLSQEAASSFDSGWQMLEQGGHYSVILDNTNAFTENYGDAQLNITVKVIEPKP